MKSKDIRESFLNYFAQRDHVIKDSASLIPNDHNLLFTIAGMVPFKPLFLGKIDPLPFTKAVSSQRCIRTNDIENVGYTARHHTFFEMLGNFSFGDYFKEEAILWGWEFLTKELSLPKEKLWVSIYLDDEEAFSIWKKFISEDRIVRLGEEDNFWKMGDTGPCGPCSEILFDQGKDVGCGKSNCSVACDCDRFLELWNLVFTQYDRLHDGTLVPLPKKNIDTGMGLERLVAVMQGKSNNFETDLFMPIINDVSESAKMPYGKEEKRDISFKIIADHLRAIVFLIYDSILPSNEGRGYVLRSLMRRAIRQGKALGFSELFLYKLIPITIKTFSMPQLDKEREDISKVVKIEEDKFSKTLDMGLKILDEIIINCKNKDIKIISGKDVFKLYDTYGFPIDLTSDIAKEHNLKIDEEGFRSLMEEQKRRAKSARIVEDDLVVTNIVSSSFAHNAVSEFVGYEKSEVAAKVLKLFKNKKEVSRAFEGEEAELVLDVTPFYGESGGQAGDRGFISSKNVKIQIEDTQKINKIIIHKGKIIEGQIAIGDKIWAKINQANRSQIAKNHTATHLLQAALRQVLGKHVKQSGSLVENIRLRFDFTHNSPLTSQELERVERIVNETIWRNFNVEIFEKNIKEAKEMGAIALFEEEYSERVRIVKIGDFSIEFCGGTHVKNTGNIGIFKLDSESGVAAGIRRIEALSEAKAYETTKLQEQYLLDVAEILKSKPEDLISRVDDLISRNKELNKEISSLKHRVFLSDLDYVLQKKRVISGVSVVSTQMKEVDIDFLRQAADILIQKLSSGIVILVTSEEDKVNWVCKVSKDLVEKIHAGKLIGKIAKITHGSGGGRADMACAGGKDPAKIPQALKESENFIFEVLNK
ncbi:MAG: alanine--tRNA ligase [bacterium]|nr:alanine--tRNA ligase [bacterium]